jgi:hypothetical protein
MVLVCRRIEKTAFLRRNPVDSIEKAAETESARRRLMRRARRTFLIRIRRTVAVEALRESGIDVFDQCDAFF